MSGTVIDDVTSDSVDAQHIQRRVKGKTVSEQVESDKSTAHSRRGSGAGTHERGKKEQHGKPLSVSEYELN